MTTLHDRLATLADDAPSALPDPGLWDRGRRYHRRRRGGTLAIVAAAAALLVLLGGVSWHRAAPPVQPATGSMGLPDRVWEPSPWLATTDRPGRLVAVTEAEHGSWTGMSPGVVGVSATTGEYAFLDLPGANSAHLDKVAVSPDGNHVAYWLSGHTVGSPSTSSSPEPVAGVAVLDTATGAVQRYRIRTQHGIEPEVLTWVDAQRVVLAAGQIVAGDDGSDMDQGSYRDGPLLVWALGGSPEPVDAGGASGSDVIVAGHGRLVVEDWSKDAAGRYRLVDLTGPLTSRSIGFPAFAGFFNNVPPVALDPTGRRLALVPGNRSPGRVHAGPVGDLREVPNTRGTWGVLDWLDADTIVTLRRARDRAEEGSALYRVSVSTGESRELVRLPALSYGAGWQFATDLLDAPTVHAEAPPTPMDPRVTSGFAVGTVLAAGVTLVLWRRRVRP